MASVIASGTFNALAFAGAGALFKMIDKDGYAKEMERHNRAMENLTRDKEKFYEKQVVKNNKLAKLRQDIADANEDNEVTNQALHDFRTLKENIENMKEPVLDDYYTPSETMDYYMNIFKVIIAGGSGWFI